MNPIAVYALTPQGVRLAQTICQHYQADLYAPSRMALASATPFTSLRECVAKSFHTYSAHIFIAATGIVVRCIAPHLVSKETDPAVIVLDQRGQYAISLVSGHLGGANTLAEDISGVINATPVITTATDAEGLPSLDVIARKAGCTIYNIDAVKHINGALLAGERVWIDDPANHLRLQSSQWANSFEFDGGLGGAESGVVVSWRTAETIAPDERTLLLHPPVLHLGIGCKKGVTADDMEQFIRQTLSTAHMALPSVIRLASVDAKAKEPALIQVAERLGISFDTFPASLLDAIDVPNPSQTPKNVVGTGSVAEAAALASCAAANKPANSTSSSKTPHPSLITEKTKLVLEKTKGNGMTLAVALEL